MICYYCKDEADQKIEHMDRPVCKECWEEILGKTARNLEACYCTLNPNMATSDVVRMLEGKYPEIMEHRYKRVPQRRQSPSTIGLTFDFSKLVTATLHIGFISVHETDDQLSLLRNGLESIKEVTESAVARSKIGKTPLKVRPIDRTAQRVAHVES